MIHSQEIDFREETLSLVMDELHPFLVRHNKEIDLYGRELNINKDVYEYLNKEGGYRVFVMRKEGKIIGYAGFFLCAHPHHVDMIMAQQDLIYLEKEYRKGFLGARLIKMCDEKLKAYGVAEVHHSVPKGINWAPLLERIGYTEFETIYTRSL